MPGAHRRVVRRARRRRAAEPGRVRALDHREPRRGVRRRRAHGRRCSRASTSRRSTWSAAARRTSCSASCTADRVGPAGARRPGRGDRDRQRARAGARAGLRARRPRGRCAPSSPRRSRRAATSPERAERLARCGQCPCASGCRQRSTAEAERHRGRRARSAASTTRASVRRTAEVADHAERDDVDDRCGAQRRLELEHAEPGEHEEDQRHDRRARAPRLAMRSITPHLGAARGARRARRGRR